MSDVHVKNYTLLQNYCEKAISQLSGECIERFKKTKDEYSRIKLLYEAATSIPITILELNGKTLKNSLERKIEGNSYFAKKDYINALKCYNDGIIKCPQNSVESRELLTILISNRSATFFALNEYKKVLNDIDYLVEIGNYPAHLNYKIWIRKAKCYHALKNENLASEACDEALKSLKFSKLDKKSIRTITQDIEKTKQTKLTLVLKHELVIAEDPEIFEGSKEYIAAHPNISFERDTYQGRYAVANGDIETGTIILEENAHGAVVDTEHALTNCQNCFLSVEQPIACSTCANVIFCSTICERLANRGYHKVECPFQESLFKSGASVNCFLALRIITQKHYSYFNDKKNRLKDYLNDNCQKTAIKKKIYRYDDYDNVFFLCRNEHLRNKEELIHFSFMSIYLLRLLKLGRYFPFKTDDKVLREEEIYFGSLILRHLQILQFNAHEVSELRNLPNSSEIQDVMNKYENASTGAAIYPTLALFNHSCDPSIVRYNIKSKMVVRTIKPVKKGDIIYENYGPLYTTMPLRERQVTLKNNYWFECLCIPCVEMWPKFDEMTDKQIRIPCKTEKCPYVHITKLEDNPFFTCEYCHKVNSIMSNLKGLMVLDTILPEAENLFCSEQLKSAMEKFLQGLNILFEYTRSPHPEIIKVQQRIRNCMIHMGNKRYNYKFDI
ncbi:SET and MYND domain-containing protein DDB_G0273589-like [Diorhabda sublineata]|uniref:SET and MYND domain-containing protein DDB_G0273589-like n=1 Tax=Diorhabda sublineata TaxID=1163346 RepID=UPI0024E0B8A0|nr:SET and MYND domain-containing protein DDB_G0273589-like [Diorhabda sublineata]